jgi:hypothetical protein
MVGMDVNPYESPKAVNNRNIEGPRRSNFLLVILVIALVGFILAALRL